MSQRVALLTLLVGLMLGLAACGQQDATQTGDADSDKPQPPAVTAMWTQSDERELTFHVWHLHCDGCAGQLTDRLEGLDGVEGVFVDRPTSEVVVEYAEGTDVDAFKQKLLAEIETPEVGKKFSILKP